MHGNPLETVWLSQHQANAVDLVDRYWHRIAARGTVPARTQIDPGDIQDALEYAFVAERVGGAVVRMRVAGGSLVSVMGMEVAGMPVSTLILPGDRAAFDETVGTLLTDPAKAVVTMRAEAEFGQPALVAEMRLYPLKDHRGEVTQVLGTFVSTGAVGRTPRRFRIAATEVVALDDIGVTCHSALRRRGHLRLVVSN